MKSWNKFVQSPFAHGIAGILSMIFVIGIARTSLFQLCYLPLILAAKFTSADSIPELGKIYPPKLVRLITFVLGMILTEIIFSAVLIAENELTFDISNAESGWTVIAIELVLGIAVYLVFFGIAALLRYFVRKLSWPKSH
jgi:hypothetical protein